MAEQRTKRYRSDLICKFKRVSQFDDEMAISLCAHRLPRWRTSDDWNDVTCPLCRQKMLPVSCPS